MVISTYRRIGNDALWYSGQVCGVDVVKIKINNGGTWIQIRDLGNGEYKVTKPETPQHGPGAQGYDN